LLAFEVGVQMDVEKDEEHPIDSVFNRDASNPKLEVFHVIVPDYWFTDP